MPHKQYFHKPTVIKDLILITVVNLFMFVIFLNYDVLEVIYHFSRQHEYFELDEVIPLGITVALSLLVFSYRRIYELGQMAQTLEHISLIDPLTNLPNRRAGQIKLISWCTNAQKNNKSFSVFQLDLDDFKSVNDLYGEAVGDEVLISISQIISGSLPEKAHLYRWLDDNFIVILPTSVSSLPFELANKLQENINGNIMPSTLSLTCSIGFSMWQKGQQPEDILHEVEDALMQAKQSGKNQIKTV
jgi:diguanylate cyclase (GGDEF)-like protein